MNPWIMVVGFHDGKGSYLINLLKDGADGQTDTTDARSDAKLLQQKAKGLDRWELSDSII